jgi:DNA-binding XRE family transcriptional regulator
MTTAVNGYRIPQWDFSDRLRKIRREVAHLTQQQMATELGASQRAYAAWETGRTKPDDIVAVAKRIALRWGIPPTWTLGLDDGPNGGGAPAAPIPSDESPLPGLNRGPLAYLVPTQPAPLQRAA